MEVHSGVPGWSVHHVYPPSGRTAHSSLRQRDFSCLPWILGNLCCREASQQEFGKVASGVPARVSAIRSGPGLLTADPIDVWKSKACGDPSVSLVSAPNPVEISRKRCRAGATRGQAVGARKSSKARKQKSEDLDVEDTCQDLRLMKVATFKVADQEEIQGSEDETLVKPPHGRAFGDAGSIYDKWGSWSERHRGAEGSDAAVTGLTEQAETSKQFAQRSGCQRFSSRGLGGRRAGCAEGMIEGANKGVAVDRGVSTGHRRLMIGGVSFPCQPVRTEEGATVIKAGGGTFELLFEAVRTLQKNKELVDVTDVGTAIEPGVLADIALQDDCHTGALGLGLGGRELESLGMWNPSRKGKTADVSNKGQRMRSSKGKDAEVGSIVKCSRTGLEGTCPGRNHRLKRIEGGDIRAADQAVESVSGVAGGVTSVGRSEATGVSHTGEHTQSNVGTAVRGSDDTAAVQGAQQQGSVGLGKKRGRPRKKVQEPGDLLSGPGVIEDRSRLSKSGAVPPAAVEGLQSGLRIGGLTTEDLQSGVLGSEGGAETWEATTEGPGSVREGNGANPPAESKKQTQKQRGLVRKEVGAAVANSGSARKGRLETKRGRPIDRGKGALVGVTVTDREASGGADESKPARLSVGTTSMGEKVDAYKDHPLRLQRQRCERCGQDKELADYRKTVSTATGFNAFCRACHAAINAARRGKVLPQESLEGRTCTDCGRFRPAVEFALKRDMPDGLKFCCRACDSLKQADYRDRVNRRRTELTHQECANCLETKPIGDFNRHRGLVTGHDTYCKQCKRERYLIWKADRRPLERPIVRDKKCARCEMTKPASEYALSVTNFDGLQTLCRGCVLLTRPGVGAGLCEQKSGQGLTSEPGGLVAIDGAISNVDS